MRNKNMRARSNGAAAIVLAAGVIAVAACDRIKTELLEPQNPGFVDQGAVGSPAAAAALKIGAIGRLKRLAYDSAPAGFAGSSLWEASGLMTDEFSNSDFQNSQNDVDQRTMSPDNQVSNYARITQARGFIVDAIAAEKQYQPDSVADIAELYAGMGFLEMNLAEDFCNGIPLGSNKAGVVDYSSPEFKPLTNAEVYATALTHVESALSTLGSAGTASANFVRQMALITKARILVDQGKFTEAAAVVPQTAIPTSYQYNWTSSASNNNDDLGTWTLNNSIARMTVGDSSMTYQGQTFRAFNAIPFASANDPRVPVVKGTDPTVKLSAEDGLTPLFIQQIWKNRDDAIPMVSGLDARLIEAEALLNAADYTGMMGILNGLRAAPPAIGAFKPAAMAALPVPASKPEAVALFFREKAFWTFGRGQRLGDLRRMIRQYGYTQDQVFPTGQHYKGGSYGSDVNFPVPDVERSNPQFKGCIDRKA